MLQALLIAFFLQASQPYDIIISNGTIVDGSGNPWFRGDVAIRGDSIVHIGLLGDVPALRRIDARGLVVAPGFIDIHTHTRRGIFQDPNAQNYIRQGVTTLLEGNDGSSPLKIQYRVIEHLCLHDCTEYLATLFQIGEYSLLP